MPGDGSDNSPEAADRDALLAAGRRVVTTEARALDALADALDESFADAVVLILAATGRVIVSGMGKSGHVARKMAATFASTGTPAFSRPERCRPLVRRTLSKSLRKFFIVRSSMRRSASSWVSPGPDRKPLPPRWRSRCVQVRTSRERS